MNSLNKTQVNIDFELAEELLGTIAELDANGVNIPNFDELYNKLYDALNNQEILCQTIKYAIKVIQVQFHVR